jgi:hypothetical protein
MNTVYGDYDVRLIEVKNPTALVGELPDGGAQVRVFVEDPRTPGEPQSTVDAPALVGHDAVLIAVTDSSGIPALTGAAVVADTGALRFPGSCDQLLTANTQQLAGRLGAATEVDAITNWLETIEAGKDTAQFASAASVNDVEQPSWESSSALTRGLTPDLVPPSLRVDLDVIALYVDFSSFPKDSVLILRTRSGIAAATRVTGGPAMPAYFLRGTDEVLTVELAPYDRMDQGVTLAETTIDDFSVMAGLLVAGDPTSSQIKLTKLNDDDVAELMSLSSAQLQELRVSLLKPPATPTSTG